MWYLFLQVWILILIAFILGWSCHWFFCCKTKKHQINHNDMSIAKHTATKDDVPTEEVIEAEPSENLGIKPAVLAISPADPDDLKRIKGIGKVIEKTLHELGIFKFEQIAAWEDSHVLWIENYVAFPGRVTREQWVDQAKTLESGGLTEFATRVDNGELDYNSI